MDTSRLTSWMKKIRILTIALIFSGALNIGFLAAFLFLSLQERQPSFTLSSLPVAAPVSAETTNAQVLKGMEKLSFRELASFLTNKDLLEEGYSKRDLAIAALAAFHHFNLEKALGVMPVQKRSIFLVDGKKVDVFPGLGEEQFDALIRYAYQEKWPLTTQGLLHLLQRCGLPRDPSLEQAFCLTPEFHALQILFLKTEAPQEDRALLELACEGNWDLLERFSREQSQLLDLSVEKRRRLLLSYLALQSPAAARLLLATDFSFALKRLNDQGISDLLQLLKQPTPESEKFCLDLLRSARSDPVLRLASSRLYEYRGETAPAFFDQQAILSHFQSPNAEKKGEAQPAAATYHLHVVKEGESLWKVARQYKMKVDEIVRLNGLEKDRLYPGMTLRIPAEQVPSD